MERQRRTAEKVILAGQMNRFLRTDVKCCCATGKNYPAADLIFTSPMLRCRQTKEILYKDQPYQIIEKMERNELWQF